ncbi:DUF3592 domain-containing protein [Streptomyces sp. SID3343]|uniref:DUF3592 domain-containing protein n=1 Tax=Streptomyces sp. SID3343 TaxID=2690260 RepID=UPI00136C5E2E|nr:DUF3592 domain-containing protein [Streptomyces sp. SID3343]MYW01621.1 hypothetical protein [Streptomyces sp. SID3343]
MTAVVPGENVVLGSGRSSARLQPRRLVVKEGRTTTAVPYEHIRAVSVAETTSVLIELHDASVHRTPRDRPDAVAVFAQALQRRVASAGAPDAGTPAVEIVTVPTRRPNISGHGWRVLGALVGWFAAVLWLGAEADTGPILSFVMGLFGLGAFAVFRVAGREWRDRYLLGKRGITVQARLKATISTGLDRRRVFVVRGQQFTTMTGDVVTARPDLSPPGFATTGDFVDILYDPQAPAERVLFARNATSAYVRVFGILMGGTLIAISPVVILGNAVLTVIG